MTKPTEIEVPKIARRTAEITNISQRMDPPEDGGKTEPRTIDLSFSSDNPIERWGIAEVLGHEDGEIRLDWIQSGKAPFLTDHRTNVDNVIGHVVSAEIKDGRGYAQVTLDQTERGNEMAGRIERGELTSVSVGYRIHGMRFEEEQDGELPVYRVTDWQPVEISLVAIPADASVGVGRSDEPDGMVRVQVERTNDMPKEDDDKKKAPATVVRTDDEIRKDREEIQARILEIWLPKMYT